MRPAGLQFTKKTLQIGAHLGGDLIAEIAVFLEELVENALEFRRNGAVQLHRRNGSGVQNVSKDDGGSGTWKRKRAGDHLIENGPKRKEVAARIENFTAGLLRRHVGNGADGGARSGLKGGFEVGDGFGFVAIRDHELSEAEVEDFGVAALGEKNVGGLDVAMNDAFFVRGVESVGNFDTDFGGFGDGEWASRQKLVEGLAFEKFHGDVGAAVLLLDGVNGADSRMIHGGGGTRFAKEALGGVGIAHGGFEQEF